MRLIRFRFGKAMGLSGAGPSPRSTRSKSQPAACLSCCSQALAVGDKLERCCESVAHPFSPS